MSDREAERQKRLGNALRENLKRRKSQSRGRAAPTKADNPKVDDATEPPDDEH